MIDDMKNKIDQELDSFLKYIDKKFALRSISPLLYAHIKEYVLRDGKRARPILFLTGYLGYAKKQAPKLYTSALAIEFIHDFMLIHDDIIDKSNQRRGKPSSHFIFNRYLSRFKECKFTGEDLSLVVGDIMHAISIEAFMSIKEKPQRKEKALGELVKAATLTGAGQFIELLSGIIKLDDLKKNDVYKIYDYKTARYTFASPLVVGATLAGASPKEINTLFNYGLHLGRAFQIKDDILGVFGKQKEIGKSVLCDIQEAKRTLLIWYTYQKGSLKQRKFIQSIFNKSRITHKDLKNIQKIMIETGSLLYAKTEIKKLEKRSHQLLQRLHIRKKEKDFLSFYSAKVLKI